MKVRSFFKKTTVISWIYIFCWLSMSSFLLTFPTMLAAEELNVALFQWVPRLDQFKTVIDEAWSQRHPDVKINFMNWDCYSDDPTPELDVFVFDGIFLSYFQSKGYLEKISLDEVDKWDDILEFSRKGTEIDGAYYGIPQLACTNFFFCQEGINGCTECINKPNSLENIYAYVGDKMNPACVIPNPDEGLLMSLSGGTTCALLYLDAVEDLNGVYSIAPTLPGPKKEDLNQSAISNLKWVLKMTGVPQAQFSEKQAYQRAGWYSSGSGKALVHYSESTWRMLYQFRNSALCKVMPLGPNPVNLFYIDIAGIKPKLSEHKKDLAMELANLITNTDTIVKCLKPFGDGPDQSFQYLLPVRNSVFDSMIESDKTGLYKKFFNVFQTCNPQVFRIGVNIRNWLKSGIKDVIKNAIFESQGKK